MKTIALLIVLFANAVFAKTIGREEALKAAFPGAEIRSQVIFLTDPEKQEVEKVSGAIISTVLVASYRALQNGKEIGRAYLDTHTVRTKKESLLVILHPDGTLKRVEVVAFLEPPEYLPSERWYQQFEGKALGENLKLERDIHAVTGATLTAKATTEAVRRVLAIDALLQRKGKSSK
ncbi:FMN-binding protein [bacterium]|nr:FMN-binding protein [bacterium]